MTKPNLKSSARKLGRKGKRQKTVTHLLEVGTLKSMRAAKQRTQDLLNYHWAYYAELAHQRNQNLDAIKRAIIESVQEFKFEHWQRGVKYKYSLHPPGTSGSLTNIGGRFNTGVEVNSNVPTHPALYLAIDKDTALQETLGQVPDPSGRLSPQEVALTNPNSYSLVAVSGFVEEVFDLRDIKSLKRLLVIFKQFKVSKALLARAKALNLDPPGIIQTPKQLLATLLDKNWRDWPQNLDSPSNSQVLGHLLYIAGAGGVIYPSKLTGKYCLAVFPHNFKGNSFIEIEDQLPHTDVPRRIDSRTWSLCDVNFEDLRPGQAPLQ